MSSGTGRTISTSLRGIVPRRCSPAASAWPRRWCCGGRRWAGGSEKRGYVACHVTATSSAGHSVALPLRSRSCSHERRGRGPCRRRCAVGECAAGKHANFRRPRTHTTAGNAPRQAQLPHLACAVRGAAALRRSSRAGIVAPWRAAAAFRPANPTHKMCLHLHRSWTCATRPSNRWARAPTAWCAARPTR